MRRRVSGWVGVAGVALLTGCLGAGARGGGSSPPDDAAPRGATVLRPEASGLPGASILELIQARMPSVQVRRSAACPEVELRGRQRLARATPPTIYVQGQRAANTCILDMLSQADVERVEVYPMGQGFRSGHVGGPGGMILIYLKDGSP